MLVQVNHDNHIAGREARAAELQDQVSATFSRFGDQITRVEVHLHDANGPKHGSDDKTCLMEARLSGHPPVVAKHGAATLDEAIDGATIKLEKAIDHVLDKITHKKGRTSMGGEQVI